MDTFPIILSCEHGGNFVPAVYRERFSGAEEVLASHRGWDPGALLIANEVAASLGVPLCANEITRLLVEPNRSPGSPSLFSEYTVSLPEREREEILDQYYFPYRNSIESAVGNFGRAHHFSIHTFTPHWEGVERKVDIGLLFDPDRSSEAALCENLLAQLQVRLPAMRIVFNEPYKGIDDGLTTYLRTVFPDDRYSGIEIEINQKHNGDRQRVAISGAMAGALKELGY
jgi:predicted N-formylglutamate amidohydrolase